MSATPRTDKAADTILAGYNDWPEFARGLERELHTAQQLLFEKNETANTFMAQVKKLQAALQGVVDYCCADICYNVEDITNIRRMAMEALGRRAIRSKESPEKQ